MIPGEMKYRIDFYKLTAVKDEYNAVSEAWTKAFSCRAKVIPLSGAQALIGDQIFPEADVLFIIYASVKKQYGFDEMNYRIVFNSENYLIDYIPPIPDQERMLKLRCRKIREK